MRLIIEMPKETYQNVIKNGFIYDEDNEVISYAIRKGTSLPKGHGKIIDVNEAINYIDDYALGFFGFDDVPAIIEADMESEEKYHA